MSMTLFFQNLQGSSRILGRQILFNGLEALAVGCTGSELQQ